MPGPLRLVLLLVYILSLLAAGILFTLAVRRFLRDDNEEHEDEGGNGDGGIPGGDSLPGGDRPAGTAVDIVLGEATGPGH